MESTRKNLKMWDKVKCFNICVIIVLEGKKGKIGHKKNMNRTWNHRFKKFCKFWAREIIKTCTWAYTVSPHSMVLIGSMTLSETMCNKANFTVGLIDRYTSWVLMTI